MTSYIFIEVMHFTRVVCNCTQLISVDWLNHVPLKKYWRKKLRELKNWIDLSHELWIFDTDINDNNNICLC